MAWEKGNLWVCWASVLGLVVFTGHISCASCLRGLGGWRCPGKGWTRWGSITGWTRWSGRFFPTSVILCGSERTLCCVAGVFSRGAALSVESDGCRRSRAGPWHLQLQGRPLPTAPALPLLLHSLGWALPLDVHLESLKRTLPMQGFPVIDLSWR